MNSARWGLLAAAFASLWTFVERPTWPCAMVALGSLVLVAAQEWAGNTRDEKAMARVDRLRDEVKAERELDMRVLLGELKSMGERVVEAHAVALDATARAERIEANRALGG